MRYVVKRVAVVSLVLAAGAAGAVYARQALPVSPGSAGAILEIEGRCPTFTWTSVNGADQYELVVYSAEQDAARDGAAGRDSRLHLRALLPGGAAAWTPSADRCLVPGASYGWSVRATAEDSGGAWSDAYLFRVASQPSAAEVAEALEILRRYVASDDAPEEALAQVGKAPSTRVEVAPKSLAGLDPALVEPLSIESAALRAEADTTGHGIVGVTGDASSAAVVAANTAAGGADLILAGNGAGSPDVALSESGIHFASSSPVVFDLTSTSGETTLAIDSVPVVTTATDKDALGALAPCAGGEIPKWTGDAWECAADDDTLAGLDCASEQIAKWNGIVWGCAADSGTGADTLASLACDSGQVAKWTGTAWQCAADVDTDTDTDTLGDLACATGQVAKRSGTSWICAADLDTDTDTDTLSDLTCGAGQVAKWTGSAWQCAADVDTDTDTDTLGDLACATGQVAKRSGTSWICAADVDTDTDTDTLGDLACGSGQVAKWTGSAWQCAADVDTDTDTDTLGDLACATGQVAKRSGTSWICAADSDTDTDTLAGLSCGSGQIAKWSGSAWQCALDAGGSPILASASVETPTAVEGTILSLSVTAPPGGCTLVVNAVGGILFDDLTPPDVQDDFDDPICALHLDDPAGIGSPLPGSRQKVAVDLFLRYDQCVSTATVALTEGSHTIDYRLTVNTDPGGNSDPATPGPTSMWAICIS